MWLIPVSISSVFAPGQACSTKQFAALFPTQGFWVTSNGKPSFRPFSWHGWARRAWSQHLFGALVLKSSSQTSGVESWIASQRAFPASPGAPPENSEALRTNGGSGPPSLGSSARSNRPSYSLRMCQASFLDEDSIAYSEMLPKWGSMRSGVIWPQAKWEPATNANAFSFWSSIRVADTEACAHPNTTNDSAPDIAGYWPTPTTAPEAPNTGSNKVNGPTSLGEATSQWQSPAADSFRSRGGDRRDEAGLDQEARMWPTPTEDNANNNGGPSRSRERGYGDLTVAVNDWPTIRPSSGERNCGATCMESSRLWPTATARDWKGSTPQSMYRGHLDQATEQIFSRQGRAMNDGAKSLPFTPGSRRRLNPAFAAWLMGMPWFWTNPASINSARSEMELWRCRLRRHFVFLLRDSFRTPRMEFCEEKES